MLSILSLLLLTLVATQGHPVNNASPLASSMLEAMAVASPKGIGEFKLLEGKSKVWLEWIRIEKQISEKSKKFDMWGPRMTKFVLVEQDQKEKE